MSKTKKEKTIEYLFNEINSAFDVPTLNSNHDVEDISFKMKGMLLKNKSKLYDDLGTTYDKHFARENNGIIFNERMTISQVFDLLMKIMGT